jgi:hypothetical protein
MAIQNLLKGNAAVGLAVGIAVAVLLPVILPAIARAAKPFAKAVIKSGLVVYDKGRETFAEISEVVEDVVAEAKSEIEQEHAATVTSAPAAGESSAPTH